MKPGKKVLYLTYDGLTDPLGQSQIIPYLLGLASAGFEFFIVSFEKEANFMQHREDVLATISGERLTWHPLTYTKKPPILSTIYDLLRMHKVIKKAKNIDLIHCRSYLPMLVALRNKHAKIVFDMRGLWADERVEGNLWPQNIGLYRMIYRYFLKKEKRFLEKADAVISLTQDGITALKERYGKFLDWTKFTVIPCCVDTKRFTLVENGPEVKKELGLAPDTKLLIHVGSVGTWYRVDQELAFYKALSELDPSWRFLILTKDIAQANTIVQKLGELVPHVVIQSARHDEVNHFLAAADASVQFIAPSFAKRASSPVKMGECFAAGIPVVANEGIGDSTQIIQEGKAGVVLKDWGDIPKIAAEFNRMAFDKRAIRNYAVQTLSLEMGIERYKGVYTQLFGHD